MKQFISQVSNLKNFISSREYNGWQPVAENNRQMRLEAKREANTGGSLWSFILDFEFWILSFFRTPVNSDLSVIPVRQVLLPAHNFLVPRVGEPSSGFPLSGNWNFIS